MKSSVVLSGRDYLSKYSLIINSLIKFFRKFPFLIKFSNSIFKNNSSKIALLVRYIMAKVYFLKAGNNLYIAALTVIKNQDQLSIGDNFSLHEFSYIDAAGRIEIGDNVSIAHNCSLISFEHTWQDLEVPIKYNPTKLHAIKIGNDVWLGCGVRVLAGSIIEERVVVAAGAVVRGVLETGYLYGGIPARKLKKL